MEVHLSPETQAKLDKLATDTGRSREEFVEDAMAGYLDELHSNCRPSAIKNANGRKNLIDALNHNPYRTCAPLFRKKNARTATARPNAVDCQR